MYDRQEKKEECEFVDSLYTNSVNLHMRRKRSYKKTKLARTGSRVILRAESRHWAKRSWCELQSCVILRVSASSRVGEKEFRPPLFFSLQEVLPLLVKVNHEKWNAGISMIVKCLIQDLNSSHQVHFQQQSDHMYKVCFCDHSCDLTSPLICSLTKDLV